MQKALQWITGLVLLLYVLIFSINVADWNFCYVNARNAFSPPVNYYMVFFGVVGSICHVVIVVLLYVLCILGTGSSHVKKAWIAVCMMLIFSLLSFQISRQGFVAGDADHVDYGVDTCTVLNWNPGNFFDYKNRTVDILHKI